MMKNGDQCGQRQRAYRISNYHFIPGVAAAARRSAAIATDLRDVWLPGTMAKPIVGKNSFSSNIVDLHTSLEKGKYIAMFNYEASILPRSR